MSSDFVDDVLNRVKPVLVAYFGEGVVIKLDKIEEEVRQDWGGTTPYIPKNKPKKKTKLQAISRLNRGAPVKEVIRETGISRSGIYRLLKERQKWQK
ncbi:helix-turn-helix domain-containing protein [Nitrosomonas sp. Is37]|uniref:helix-turn-helix domain-containing protein n=1 Tax=Nitrosomonas sp. Is37 TaxID=3080535 RepID=UPI00294B8843|nr:helix-turn-helix domain-containing protein [Nitrosomonas sp. Is37]MDV6345639.1 helix-turn-helix domain-containing protein [Nitrosomonas sp. Is37]